MRLGGYNIVQQMPVMLKQVMLIELKIDYEYERKL